MGLATLMNKKKYLPNEREAGKASFTMGLFGITEGAIPFAAQDPIRVIPSIVAGSVVGSVIAMLGNVGGKVAHGGPIVVVLGAVDHVVMFFVAAIAGVLVTAFLVNFLKKDVETVSNDKIQEDSNSIAPEQEVEQEIEKLVDITNVELMNINLAGTTRDAVIDELIEKFDLQGILTSKDEYKQAILNREEQSSTGLGMNIAIPHGKSNAVKRPAVAFGIKRAGVDWNSLDGTDAKLIFMIAVPEENAGDAHLKILQMLSRKLMDEDFRNQLLNVSSKQEAMAVLEEVH
jgi:PTS system fructose-specific IIC component